MFDTTHYAHFIRNALRIQDKKKTVHAYARRVIIKELVGKDTRMPLINNLYKFAWLWVIPRRF